MRLDGRPWAMNTHGPHCYQIVACLRQTMAICTLPHHYTMQTNCTPYNDSPLAVDAFDFMR